MFALGCNLGTLLLLALVTVTNTVAGFAFTVQGNHVSGNMSARPLTLRQHRNLGSNTVVFGGSYGFVHTVERNDNAPNSGLNETHTDHITAPQLDLRLVGAQDKFRRDNFTPLIIGGIDAVGGGFFVAAHYSFVLRRYHRTETRTVPSADVLLLENFLHFLCPRVRFDNAANNLPFLGNAIGNALADPVGLLLIFIRDQEELCGVAKIRTDADLHAFGDHFLLRAALDSQS